MRAAGLRRRAAGMFAPRREESGNGIVFFIAVLPVVISSFGLGLDITRNVYIRSQIQAGLDSATVAGAAVTAVAGPTVVINTAPAVQTARYYYAVNRPGSLKCTGTGAVIAKPYAPGENTAVGLNDNPARACWTGGLPTVAAGGQSLNWQVKEVSPNSGFLSLVKINTQTYNVKSRAVLRK